MPKTFHHRYTKYITLRDPKTRRSYRAYSPEYISASTASLEFILNSVNGGAIPSGFTAIEYMNLSTCTDVSGTYTCNLAWTVPAALDAFTVFACDGVNCSGNTLSKNSITKTVVAGANSIGITLWGVPHSITIVPSGYSTGTSPAFTLPSAISNNNGYTAEALDADGNIITTYNQFVFSNESAFTFASLSAQAILATPPHSRVSVTGGFTATLDTASLGYPYSCLVSQCSVSATLTTATPPHSVVVPDTAGTSDTINVFAGSDVDTALLGATNVASTGSMTASCVNGVNRGYLDTAGNFYALCEQGAGATATINVWSAARVQSAALTTGVTKSGTLTCGPAHSPTGAACGNANGTLVAITVDGSGNVFATDGGQGVYVWSASDVATALSGTNGVQATGGISSIGPNLGHLARIASTLMVMDSTNSTNTACTGGPWAGTYAKSSVVSAALGGSFSGTMSGCMVNASNGMAGPSPEELLNIGGNAYFTASIGGTCSITCSTGSLQVQAYTNVAIGGWTNTGAGQTKTGSFTDTFNPSVSSFGLVADAAGDVFEGDQGSSTVAGYSAASVTAALTANKSVSSGSWQGSGVVWGMDVDTSTNTLFYSAHGNGLVNVLNSAGVTLLASGGSPTTTGTLSAPGADIPWDF